MRALSVQPAAAHAPAASGSRCRAVPAAAATAAPWRHCHGRRLQRFGGCSSNSSSGGSAWRRRAVEAEGAAPIVAGPGDIVTLNWKCLNEEGELLESSEQAEEPTTFEVGAGDIVGNKLFEAFDEAVRGLAVGEGTRIKATGGEWREELIFRVPREHPEIARLEGRYKNQGGVKEGLLVELANGGLALVVKADDEAVVLDANNMLAGKALWFELELAALDRPGPA